MTATPGVPHRYPNIDRTWPYIHCMTTTTNKLTASQTRNLEIIRAAGGVVLAKGWDWVAPGSVKAIRGLNGKTLRGLARAGLIRAFDSTGAPATFCRPARIEVAS